ncbi:MAG: hypothetical protein PUJ82_06625 [Spirochaetales bacterium]|nr:hypothetical protein [Spirochaetales bacterium]MDY5914478.1 hypothetical protein [Treponema sp.]
MFHNKFSRFLAVFITVVSLCAFGCKTQPEEDFISDLYGKWTSSFGEVFEISKDYFKNYGEDWNGYEGDSINIITNENDNTSGTIFLKYTVSANPDWSYSNTAPDVGKWYAVNYKNLTKNSVSLSGAYKSDGKTSTETLEEAKEEFTVENGYFASYSECTKSE